VTTRPSKCHPAAHGSHTDMARWHKMATNARRRSRLSVDVDPDVRRRLKVEAASRDLSIRSYLEGVIRKALADKRNADKSWAALSARSFARDWGSEEDSAYDSLT
jgi:hypothetical protein